MKPSSEVAIRLDATEYGAPTAESPGTSRQPRPSPSLEAPGGAPAGRSSMGPLANRVQLAIAAPVARNFVLDAQAALRETMLGAERRASERPVFQAAFRAFAQGQAAATAIPSVTAPALLGAWNAIHQTLDLVSILTERSAYPAAQAALTDLATVARSVLFAQLRPLQEARGLEFERHLVALPRRLDGFLALFAEHQQKICETEHGPRRDEAFNQASVALQRALSDTPLSSTSPAEEHATRVEAASDAQLERFRAELPALANALKSTTAIGDVTTIAERLPADMAHLAITAVTILADLYARSDAQRAPEAKRDLGRYATEARRLLTERLQTLFHAVDTGSLREGMAELPAWLQSLRDATQTQSVEVAMRSRPSNAAAADFKERLGHWANKIGDGHWHLLGDFVSNPLLGVVSQRIVQAMDGFRRQILVAEARGDEALTAEVHRHAREVRATLKAALLQTASRPVDTVMEDMQKLFQEVESQAHKFRDAVQQAMSAAAVREAGQAGAPDAPSRNDLQAQGGSLLPERPLAAQPAAGQAMASSQDVSPAQPSAGASTVPKAMSRIRGFVEMARSRLGGGSRSPATQPASINGASAQATERDRASYRRREEYLDFRARRAAEIRSEMGDPALLIEQLRVHTEKWRERLLAFSRSAAPLPDAPEAFPGEVAATREWRQAVDRAMVPLERICEDVQSLPPQFRGFQNIWQDALGPLLDKMGMAVWEELPLGVAGEQVRDPMQTEERLTSLRADFLQQFTGEIAQHMLIVPVFFGRETKEVVDRMRQEEWLSRQAVRRSSFRRASSHVAEVARLAGAGERADITTGRFKVCDPAIAGILQVFNARLERIARMPRLAPDEFRLPIVQGLLDHGDAIARRCIVDMSEATGNALIEVCAKDVRDAGGREVAALASILESGLQQCQTALCAELEKCLRELATPLTWLSPESPPGKAFASLAGRAIPRELIGAITKDPVGPDLAHWFLHGRDVAPTAAGGSSPRPGAPSSQTATIQPLEPNLREWRPVLVAPILRAKDELSRLDEVALAGVRHARADGFGGDTIRERLFARAHQAIATTELALKGELDRLLGECVKLSNVDGASARAARLGTAYKDIALLSKLRIEGSTKDSRALLPQHQRALVPNRGLMEACRAEMKRVALRVIVENRRAGPRTPPLAEGEPGIEQIAQSLCGGLTEAEIRKAGVRATLAGVLPQPVRARLSGRAAPSD
jgi:hypothetical protein